MRKLDNMHTKLFYHKQIDSYRYYLRLSFLLILFKKQYVKCNILNDIILEHLNSFVIITP